MQEFDILCGISKGTFWNSSQNILPMHWKMRFLYSIEILGALGFKSSYMFFKRLPLYLRTTQQISCCVYLAIIAMRIFIFVIHMLL